MFGLFSTSSSTDRRTYTTTNTYDGSFNTNYSLARTNENVGNTSLTIGLPGGSTGGADYVLIALAALLGLAGVALLFRSP